MVENDQPVVFWDSHWVVHFVANVRAIRETHERYGFVENWQVHVVCMPDKPVHEVLDVHGGKGFQADLGVGRYRGDVVTCLRCLGLPCS